jgi:hypothetical protein
MDALTGAGIARAPLLEKHKRIIRRPPIDIDAIAEAEGLEYAPAEFSLASGGYFGLGDGCGRVAAAAVRIRELGYEEAVRR